LKIRSLFAAQSPQGLKRCADAQRFFIRKNVVQEAQHSKRAYSQLFLKKNQTFSCCSIAAGAKALC